MRTLDYPTLRHLFGAYLNRDWPDEYGTVEKALKAYRTQNDASRCGRALDEIDKLLAAGVPDAELGQFVSDLGCEYVFDEGPDAAAAFLKMVRAQLAA